MSPVRQCVVYLDYNALYFVPPSPLNITRMLIYPPHVLPHLRIDALQKVSVDRIQSVREYELGPSKDSKLVTSRIEIIPACQFVRGLIDTSSPDTELGGTHRYRGISHSNPQTYHVLTAENSALKDPPHLF